MWEVSKRVRYRLIIDTVITRVTVFLLQFIFSSFDFSTDAFKGLKESETWIDWTFRGFMRWDSIQFLHVAEHGYVYEHSLAFFPLFPTVLRYVASILETVSTGVLYSPSTFVLAAVILNSVTFFVSSLLIFDICFILTSSHKISQISTLLFSINPASIFFSSIYTESLYCCLSLLGIRLLISSKSSLFFTTLILSLAFLTRSNGLLNIGYLLFYEGLRLVGPRTDRLWNRNVRVQFLKIGIYLIRIGMAIACILFALQIHSNRQMKRFCSEPFPDIAQSLIELGQRENLSMIGTPVAWCTELSLIYPPFYSSIQGQYWDVNLFGYWK
uniref:GPI mannosyltransferase 2 n=1 Tax=Pristionchus pacificus TaxID=54126 RepID=A0A2A6CCM6_PRIPA